MSDAIMQPEERLRYLAALPLLWPEDMQEVVELVRLTRRPVTVRRTDLSKGTVQIIVIEPDGQTEV